MGGNRASSGGEPEFDLLGTGERTEVFDQSFPLPGSLTPLDSHHPRGRNSDPYGVDRCLVATGSIRFREGGELFPVVPISRANLVRVSVEPRITLGPTDRD